MTWITDPANPGYLLKEDADAALESSWVQIPEGFEPDINDPSWYFNGGDPNLPSSWWQPSDAPADPGGATVAPSIINTEGDDIGPMMKQAADAAGIPLELALTCAIAESGLNPKAARYGAWPDISFGYGQQIVLYHYAGDHTSSQANINAVRDEVFNNPQGNLDDMCRRLASYLQRVQGVDLSPVNGDPLIGALVVYNSGSFHAASDPWWGQWMSNVRNYQQAQVRARQMIGA